MNDYATFNKDIRKPRVAIIGAGVAGISTAVALKNQLGYEDFIIYEKADEIGGTWRDNKYPGCGSDVGCHWYSLSTELNPDWKSYYAGQPEIRRYWESVFEKHKLGKYLVTGTNVRFARWDNAKQAYELTLEDVRSGERRSAYTEILVWAVGGFMRPAYPKDLPGKDVFKGEVWHSARWRDDVPLSGKKVGVIGNGCSSAQIIPELAKDPTTQILNFCRTPQWYVERRQYDYPAAVKWIFRNIPFVLRWYRNFIMITMDFGYLIFSKKNPTLLRMYRRTLEKYIKEKAPKEYHEVLTPNFPPGCRRIIVDPGYLESLHKPNVGMCWEPIDAIVEDGIKMKSGAVVPLDVIVLGTGFELESSELDLQGSDGRTLGSYFESKNGPSAYLGASIPGFPNFFMLLGPNTVVGHASAIFAEEVQIQYALQLMKPVIDGLAKSFEIRDEDSDAYNRYLDNRQSASVTQDCSSYYRWNRKGRNFALFPGPVTLFYWLARKIKWESYKVVGGEKWEAQRRREARKKWSVRFAFVVVVAVCGSAGIVRSGRL